MRRAARQEDGRIMKKTGLIAAVEMFAVFEKWGEPDAKYDGLPFKACSYERCGSTIYVVRSGPGQDAARAAAQMAIDEFKVTEIWNFGVVGSLVPELKIGDICIVQETVRWDVPKEQAVLYKTDASMSRAFKARCASGDSVVAGKAARIAVAEQTGSHIVDMEAAAIAETAEAAGISCRMIKCVSDDLGTGMQELTDAFRPTARRAFEAFSRIYETRK